MTESEARGFIQGKLDCMNECGVFNREDIEKKDLCDSCDYCYSQGNFGEQKEAFSVAIKALEKQEKIKKAFEMWKTETETIRDKAVRWNNNSSKRVPYEFIDYVEGKREISVSDDVCEWTLTDTRKVMPYKTSCGNEDLYDNSWKYCPHCSKKIKVVE